jgi:hypothetical protein
MKKTSKFATLALTVAILATSLTAFAHAEEGGGLKEAIENEDYATFSEFYEEKTGEELSQESFEKILEAHDLEMQAREIRQELRDAGVKLPMKHGQRKGMHRGEHAEMFNK